MGPQSSPETPVGCAARSRSHCSVKGNGNSRDRTRRRVFVPRLGTSCGKPPVASDRASGPGRAPSRRGFGPAQRADRSSTEGTSGAACSGSLRGDPGDAALIFEGLRASELVEGRESRSLAGRGSWGEIARTASLPRRERRATSILERARNAPRELSSTVQRSHDERCPNGSGRGKARVEPPARVVRARASAKADSPLTRETSAGDRRAFGAHASGTRQGLLPSLERGSEAGDARKRTPAAFLRERRESGDRRGGARGLWLVAEVDERRPVQVEQTTGLARRRACRKARARGG